MNPTPENIASVLDFFAIPHPEKAQCSGCEHVSDFDFGRSRVLIGDVLHVKGFDIMSTELVSLRFLWAKFGTRESLNQIFAGEVVDVIDKCSGRGVYTKKQFKNHNTQALWTLISSLAK